MAKSRWNNGRALAINKSRPDLDHISNSDEIYSDRKETRLTYMSMSPNPMVLYVMKHA